MKYPPSCRPSFIVGKFALTVVDLAAQGIGVIIPPQTKVDIANPLAGVLRFHDGSSTQIEGIALRRHGEVTVLRLFTPFPKELFHREIDRHNTGPDRRRYFRLRYPVGDGPRCVIDLIRYGTVEISEFGLVIDCGDDPLPLGKLAKAALTFHDDKQIMVTGIVYRIRKHEVVLKLSEGIPSQVIVKEQLRVIRTYR